LRDEQEEQIFAMTDDIAERARKIGGTTLHSIGDVARHQRLKDNNEESVPPMDMLSESVLVTSILRALYALPISISKRTITSGCFLSA
jgi:starvation-inducible DNA-binding protein